MSDLKIFAVCGTCGQHYCQNQGVEVQCPKCGSQLIDTLEMTTTQPSWFSYNRREPLIYRFLKRWFRIK